MIKEKESWLVDRLVVIINDHDLYDNVEEIRMELIAILDNLGFVQKVNNCS